MTLPVASFRVIGCGTSVVECECREYADRMSRSKIVENLAVVNYDTNNLHLAPYDWRLSFYNLEERDGYFSKLKATIEGFRCVFVTPTSSGFS